MEKMNRTEMTASVVGAFIGTLAATFFSYMLLGADQSPIILASTGASAILIFGMPHVPAAQPWNLVGGHVVSAIVGVSCFKLLPYIIVASAIAIPISMLFMHLLRCNHPPGGATAITAIMGGELIHELGYAFVMAPVFINSIILLSVAMAVATFREKNPFSEDMGTWKGK